MAMAMSNSCMILPKAFSAVTPRALRPVSSPRIIPAAVNKMDNSNHHFCTDAKENLLHQKIVTALKTQMKTPKLIALDKAIPPVPADFPFTIKEFNYVCCWLILTRELDGETIDVRVSIPSSHRNSSSPYDDNFLKESTADIAPSVYMTVKISREDGDGLHFEVSASSDDIRVTYLSVNEHAPDSDHTRHFGYYELKDGSELQLALGEYVEMRGIEKKYTEFLFNYMVESHKRRPVVVLEKLENYLNE